MPFILVQRSRSISELVKHDVNGMLFGDSNELTKNLCHLLKNFPENKAKLNQFAEHIKVNFLNLRWEENWNRTVLPLLKSDC